MDCFDSTARHISGGLSLDAEEMLTAYTQAVVGSVVVVMNFVETLLERGLPACLRLVELLTLVVACSIVPARCLKGWCHPHKGNGGTDSAPLSRNERNSIGDSSSSASG